MSTEFRSLTPIHMPVLLDGRLETFGVREHHVAADHEWANEPRARCLTDGRNFLWVFCDEMGMVESFTTWAGNFADLILYAITEVFKVEIVAEHEPRYWGFETEEELYAVLRAMAIADAKIAGAKIPNEAYTKEEQDFYGEIIKFARGESDKIVTDRPESVAIEMAEIAKRLIAQSPELLAEDKRADLIEAIHAWYLLAPFTR